MGILLQVTNFSTVLVPDLPCYLCIWDIWKVICVWFTKKKKNQEKEKKPSGESAFELLLKLLATYTFIISNKV